MLWYIQSVRQWAWYRWCAHYIHNYISMWGLGPVSKHAVDGIVKINIFWLVVWNILFFHILGMSKSQLTNIFQRGRLTTNQIWLCLKIGGSPINIASIGGIPYSPEPRMDYTFSHTYVHIYIYVCMYRHFV